MDEELLTILNWLHAVQLPDHPAVQTHSRWLVLDTLGCVWAGRQAQPVVAYEQKVADLDPGVFHFPHGAGLSVSGAAMVLAMAACWDEACEGHAGAHGRPGVAALAALLPLASRLSYGEFLKSFVVGYEVGARFGAALRIRKGMHVDGNWPALGAAAAAAYAIGLPPQGILTAIQIAACQLPVSLYLPVRFGSTARNTYLGHAAVIGQMAALAAASGVTAPPHAAQEYAKIGLGVGHCALPGLGRFHTLEAYFKPYAAVRHVHYGALAALQIRDDLALDSIESIDLQVYEEATVYCGNRGPQEPLQAQFSLSFGVAAMLRWGRLDPWVYREPQFQDALLRQIEAKVRLSVDAEWTRHNQRGARLHLKMRDGSSRMQEVTAVPGDVDMPFTEKALLEKFLGYAATSKADDPVNASAEQWLHGPDYAKPFPFWPTLIYTKP